MNNLVELMVKFQKMYPDAANDSLLSDLIEAVRTEAIEETRRALSNKVLAWMSIIQDSIDQLKGEML